MSLTPEQSEIVRRFVMKWIVEYLQHLHRGRRISKHEFETCMSLLFE